MQFNLITPDNFLLYATKMYDNPHCTSIDEFNSDLRRFSSAKRLLLRLERGDDSVNIQMLLNHVIIIQNLFGPTAATRLLYAYCPAELHPFLSTVFEFLNILSPNVPEVNGQGRRIIQNIINKLHEL